MDTLAFVPVHVIAGTLGIVSGFVALSAVKGSGLHRKSGMVVVCVMLVMSLSGTVMAFGHPGTALNVPARLVKAYLVMMAYWLWRYRRKRSARNVVNLGAPEAV